MSNRFHVTIAATILLLTSVTIRQAHAQAVYPSSPDWVSTDTQRSTGAALVDLDRDGWPDLVVSNGNDMNQQHVAVYYNQGDGTYPGTPDWQSTDFAYNGHLDVADVNGDGWLDVAVAHLGRYSSHGPIAKVYLNNSGTLSSTPDWSADITGNAFGVAFGDINQDGRPDLAVATGWAYEPQYAYPNYVYFNVGGSLEPTASWQSDDTYHYQGFLWVDADDDGLLDLVGSANGTQARMYRNIGGTLETTASWATTDAANQDGIMAAAGDVDGDGAIDLFLTDNTQTAGGSGRHRQYSGIDGGTFATTYSWSYYDGYGSAIAVADINADGDLDLATGAWWGETRLFFNTGAGIPPTPTWSAGNTSVIEKIVFSDIDRNGLHPVTETFLPDGTRRLFYFQHQPIQEILAIRRDGIALFPSEYTFNRESGWIAISTEPTVGLEIDYLASSKLDMAVTNWDSDEGNFVYLNRLEVDGDANCDGRLDMADVPLFVLALLDRASYNAAYDGCDIDTFCDLNDDLALNGRDIQAFVSLLVSGA